MLSEYSIFEVKNYLLWNYWLEIIFIGKYFNLFMIKSVEKIWNMGGTQVR